MKLVDTKRLVLVGLLAVLGEGGREGGGEEGREGGVE